MTPEGFLLGIDTCSRRLELALLSAGGETAGRSSEESASHASVLPGAVGRLLETASIDIRELSGIAVISGPGSFTGLRVGIATAVAMKHALGLPLFGLSSLYCLARLSPAEGRGGCFLDARKREFYFQLFEKNSSGLHAWARPVTMPVEEAAGAMEALDWAVAGRCGELFPSRPPNLFVMDAPGLAEEAARAALERIRAGEKGEETVVPIYVREADAVPMS